MTKLLDKLFLIGMCIMVSSTLLILISYYLQNSKDLAAWVTLVISAGIGISIAVVVDEKSEKSHQEVLKSQITIQQLLERLDSTNLKHKETLSMLDSGRIKNESAAFFTVTKNWDYIDEYLETVLNAIDRSSSTLKQKKDLISKTVLHIESPINIIEQAIQNTGTCLSESQRNTMLSLTSILRKIIILATLELDSKIDEIISDLHTSMNKISNLIIEINSNQA